MPYGARTSVRLRRIRNPPQPFGVSGAALPLGRLLSAIGSERRWQSLRELVKGEALPVYEVARRLRATPAGISKHFAVLHASGIVRRTYGDHLLCR